MDILACPHCHRQFQLSPAACGKKIRCRGCRQIFHVPHDTSKAPLGPLPVGGPPPTESVPSAIPCLVDGKEARRCPDCSRTFAMRPEFVGKTIRCRRCRLPFVVLAADPGSLVASPAAVPRVPPVPQPARPRAASRPAPDDVGDILDELRPGERVALVERLLESREATSMNAILASPVVILFGTACALLATQLILWWVFGKDPLGIAAQLPAALRWIAPLGIGP